MKTTGESAVATAMLDESALVGAVREVVAKPQAAEGGAAAVETSVVEVQQEELSAASLANAARLRDIFGVRQTARGILFVQPAGLGDNICIAGEFNNWSATALPLRHDAELGVHTGMIELPPGRYFYRLVVDGRWQADSYNPQQETNSYHEPNSVLMVS